MSGDINQTTNGPLAGKRALITGAAGGMGLLAARALAQTGAGLVIAGRNAQAMETVAATLGGDFNVEVEVEVSNPANAVDAEALAMAAADANIFVSCSGNLPRGRLGAVGAMDWGRSWQAAVFGPINLIREMWSHMCDTPGALVVVIIDSSMTPDLNDACATAAGGALMALVEALGKAHDEDPEQPRIVGLITGRKADDVDLGANVATAISMLACNPTGWTSGTLLTPQAVLANSQTKTQGQP